MTEVLVGRVTDPDPGEQLFECQLCGFRFDARWMPFGANVYKLHTPNEDEVNVCINCERERLIREVAFAERELEVGNRELAILIKQMDDLSESMRFVDVDERY